MAPLLDKLLDDAPPSGTFAGFTFGALDDLIAVPSPSTSTILPRVIEAHLAGYPGPWKRLATACKEVIDGSPLVDRRALAARCLARTDDGHGRTWAIDQLLGPLHDAAVDPPRAEMAAAFATAPSTRAIMLAGAAHCTLALPVFREALRARALTVDHASTVLSAIDRLWGGMTELTPFSFFMHDRGKARGAKGRDRSEALTEAADFVGDPAWHGPITEAEWGVWRALRDEAIATGVEKPEAMLSQMPGGVIGPDDRPVFEEAMRRWREGHDDNVAHHIVAFAATHLDPWVVPMLDELVRGAADARAKHTATAARDFVCDLVGIAIPDDATSAADDDAPDDAGDAQAQEAEWMDQDE